MMPSGVYAKCMVDEAEHDEADEPEPKDQETEGQKKIRSAQNSARQVPTDKADPSEKQRTRLRDQMRQCFERFCAEDFPESCTATQMVQAAAYPLAVATIGSRGGWVDADEAQVWVVQVFDVLFRTRFPGPRYGLLTALDHCHLLSNICGCWIT